MGARRRGGGARQPERAQRSAETVALYNVIILGVAGTLFVVAPSLLVGLVTSEPEALDYGAMCLRIVGIAVAYPFQGAVAATLFRRGRWKTAKVS